MKLQKITAAVLLVIMLFASYGCTGTGEPAPATQNQQLILTNAAACNTNCLVLSNILNQLKNGTLTGDEPVDALTPAVITDASFMLSGLRPVSQDSAISQMLVGGVLPECPFATLEGNSRCNYSVASDGTVTCLNAHTGV